MSWCPLARPTSTSLRRSRVLIGVWEPTTSRLLDQVALAPGARCLDAGCGPGETMRLMAQRVGPSGRVTGIDVDASLGATGAVDAPRRRPSPVRVRAARRNGRGSDSLRHRSTWCTHGCCSTTCPSASRCCGACGTPSPQAGIWSFRTTTCRASASSRRSTVVEEIGSRPRRGVHRRGLRRAHRRAASLDLFAQAGIGAPDGTDVSGRLEPLAETQRMLSGCLHEPAAGRDERTASRPRRAAAVDARSVRCATPSASPSDPTLWPLLIGAWKRKPTAAESEPTR